MLLSLVIAVSCSAGAPVPVPGDSLVRLFESGKRWTEFVDGARARRDAWHDNYRDAAVDSGLVVRARAVGPWRVLVVAEDWCFDSVNTLPYVVRLFETVPELDLRIVASSQGRWVMNRHRTPDGRAATPTFVILGRDGEERGCFIERPAGLRAWVAENKPKLSEADFQDGKARWYRDERGRETTAELVALLEAAALGEGRCP